MRNEDGRATDEALAAVKRISDPVARQHAARELEIHYSRAVITLRHIHDEAQLQIERRAAAHAVGQRLSDAAVEGRSAGR